MAFCASIHSVCIRLLGFAFVLCCVVDLEPCLLSCPGSSVGRALCLESRVSWVRVSPRAAPFSSEKGVFPVGVANRSFQVFVSICVFVRLQPITPTVLCVSVYAKFESSYVTLRKLQL